MRFVPIKSNDQLDMQSLHRVRDRWVARRTSVVNQMRGLLLERGITFRRGRRHAEASLPDVLEDPENGLSGPLRMLPAQLQSELRQLQSQIDEADTLIGKAAGEHEPCRRLMGIPGIGPLTATAVAASIGNGSEFRKGRSFAAWLGLVPKQESTGGKQQKLLSISNRGNHYLRRLFVSGARTVCSAGTSNHQASAHGLASLHPEFTRTSRLSHWPIRWLASPGRCWPRTKPIALRCR
jgi:transposase